MNTPAFVHLRCHSDYSLLRGTSSVEQLLERANAMGIDALALTDTGNLYGAMAFYRTAREIGIKPIIGCEVYIAPGRYGQGVLEREPETADRVVLLAQNRTGFRNLLKLASAACLERAYVELGIDTDLLAAHHEGLICLSGGMSGRLNRVLLDVANQKANLDSAMAVAAWYRDLFGDRYFIEIQNDGLEAQRNAMEGAVEVARRLAVPPVATSDVHYATRKEAETCKLLLCISINAGKPQTEADRERCEGGDFYLRSPGEMYAAFPGHEDALQRSREIADSIRHSSPNTTAK